MLLLGGTVAVLDENTVTLLLESGNTLYEVGVLLDQKRGNKCTVALLDKNKVTYLGGENMLYEVVRRGTACWTREVDGDEWGLQRPCWMRNRLRC